MMQRTKRIVFLASLILAFTATSVTPQGATGRIDVFISRGSSTDGVADVGLTLQGPYPVASAAQIAGLYTPNPALTSDMRAQVDALIASAPIGISAEVVANAAMRMEAQLLGLPTPNVSAQANAPAPPQLTGLSTPSGHYSFADLAPGRYQIRAQREGYFAQPPAGVSGVSLPTTANSTVTLEVGKSSAEVSIAMIRGGIVSGSVRDPKGQAMFGAQIGAYQVAYQNSRVVLQQLNSKQTDDRGDYRLFWLPPGEYYLAVIPRRGGINVPTAQDAYARTYFPGTSDPASATRIKVPEGGEVGGIDIAVRADAIGKISGRVVTSIVMPNGQPATASTFYLLPTIDSAFTDTSTLNFPNMASDRTNGHFEIRGILPGSYDLITMITSNTVGPTIGRAHVDVGAGDVDNVILNVKPGASVKAKLILDSGAVPFTMAPPPQTNRVLEVINGTIVESLSTTTPSAPVPTPTYRIQLRSMESYPSPFDNATQQGMVFDPSGSFTFPNVPAGRYAVAVTPMLPNSFIADVRSSGKSLFDDGFDVGALTGDIEVTVSSKGGKVQGTVRNASQKPVPSARVVLVPPPTRRQNSALYKTAAADVNGKFTITGVAPGDYSLYAWESVQANAWMNAEFMAHFENEGQPISVTQGSDTTRDITAIPANAPQF